MTVARRLGLGLGLHFLLLLALLLFHVRTIRHAVTTAHDLSEVSASLVLSAARQSARVGQIDDAAAKFLVTGDSGYLRQFELTRTMFSAELDQWPALPGSEEEAAAIGAAMAAWAPLRRADVRSGRWAEMNAPLAAASETAQRTMRARLERASADAARASVLSLLAAVGALLLAVITAWLLSRSITGPLRRLAAGTREVAKGRFGYRLDTRRGDEFAQVADAFNTMTQRLGALDKMKQDFVSSVSHDLKSPLASLRETTTLMLDGLPGPLNPTQRRLLLLQRESADRLGLMIAKLLDLSRLEAGLPLALRREAIGRILADSVTHAATAATERDVRVALAMPDGDLHLTCDADRVRQLVDNLLENAVKFSPRGALVEVVARTERDRLLITVADRGAGIPPELREKVFERFYQTSEGRLVHGRGVGLGLTIVRQIAHAHGGEVMVEGREGGGTVFLVTMPGLERDDEEPRPVPGAAGATHRASPAASRRRVAIGVMLLVTVAGCAGRQRPVFDDHLRAGRWTEAAAHFERDSALHRDPEALRLMADVHAVPSRPEWDPERAAQLYALARLHSRSGWTMPLASARSAALVEEVVRLRDARHGRERDLLARLAAIEATAAALRAERDSLARVAARSDEEIASRVRTITRLERQLQERESEARSLRLSLERLKAIDLRKPPT